jgi:hypothetical protein
MGTIFENPVLLNINLYFHMNRDIKIKCSFSIILNAFFKSLANRGQQDVVVLPTGDLTADCKYLYIPKKNHLSCGKGRAR